jgi:hypothetical protein
MLYACIQRFDVMKNLEKFYKILGTKHAHVCGSGRALSPCAAAAGERNAERKKERPPNPKYFLLHTSHQIFRRMHGVLNVGKKDN